MIKNITKNLYLCNILFHSPTYMENNYDIEFDITSILNQILYGSSNTRGASSVDSAGSDISGAWISMMHTNQSIIENLIYSYNNQMQRYNQNMERYNNNMERIIQLLFSYQTQIQQHFTPIRANTPTPTTVPRTNNINSQRRNDERNEGNLIRLLLNTSHYGTNRNTANMLYAYLYPNRGAFTRELSTPVQRANAIQTITYNQGERPNRDNICPISLLSFQEGERISQIKHCMHIFKTEYLNNWLTNYSSCCPVCRYDIRNYNSENNDNAGNNNQNDNDDSSETDE